MTTIFSNNEDIDSVVLMNIFQNIPNNNVIEIKYVMKSSDWKDKVEDAIENEEDTLIICGHGSPCGLYFPRFEEYIINDRNVAKIRAKRVICCWCYASEFVKIYDVHNCVATNMFISNTSEARCNGYLGRAQDGINTTCEQIYREINSLVCSDTPIGEWKKRIMENIDEDNDVDVFNRQGIIFNE